ncbi:D-alanyl-lipoteichoic acid acyltransferase DltB (MBOAT superfamily) [Pontibacter ummariensis]|uniref:D-alanyl-lipoteichoic acid acyltransferase DltB, MBOAT superfamily n=1 Tax=Pontibacter ummariensis TaxID=1610492 RepID=A0A239GEC9_9BACT|nr:MBOAT family O-acyltransferase [Pontibacter ummariensis]PRY11228.1 D-alanyl-lipoteichoic acid acyltransferase DltB (MBOAT superfamily) [Pontibacter ummariensis]SNS67557.1 D-alanyl-lipoteichoic acid acyltransferase DltB, MBOAT superfamily [Pontibacter ummariensis]
MLFNSTEFFIFFPVVVTLYFLTPFNRRWIILLLASYYFYMSWNPAYTLILLASTCVDYVSGRAMGKYTDEEKDKRKPWLYLSLGANLGTLLLFKYYNFFNESARDLAMGLDVPYAMPAFELLLPMGISFYTFQTMSYSIDVYHGQIKPERNLGVFALFVSFFPQLVAGPIERAGNLLGQLHQNHRFDYYRVVAGLRRMAWGFFKKVVIADNLALMVNAVYNNPSEFEGVSFIIATIFFAFQIYCDFSGYTDIAIGAAQVMGFHLMENFRRPYFSKTISEFWGRWHISLSTWFRDYLYIPLGGNRVVKWRWYYNLFLTFLVSGLWHGANWTFIIWGALHGFYLVFAIITAKQRNNFVRKIGLSEHPQLYKWIQVLTVFTLVCFSWIFFRANTITDAFYIVRESFASIGNVSQVFAMDVSHALFMDQGARVFTISVLSIILMETVHLVQRNGSVSQLIMQRPAWVRWSVYYLAIIVVLLFGQYGQQEFIYFQF